MVVFTCDSCGDSVKKNQVDTHRVRCRRCVELTCLDCQKTFRGEEFRLHNICISENQKYGGKNYIPKASETGSKQNNWMEVLRKNLETTKVNDKLKLVLEDIMTFENIPKKKPKFMNFMKSNPKFNKLNPRVIEEAWTFFEQALKAMKLETPAKKPPVSKNKTTVENKTTNGEKSTQSNGVNKIENGSETTISTGPGNVEKGSKKKRKGKNEKTENGELNVPDSKMVNQDEVQNGTNNDENEDQNDAQSKKKIKRKKKGDENELKVAENKNVDIQEKVDDVQEENSKKKKKGNKKKPVNQQEDNEDQVEAQKEKVDIVVDLQEEKSKRQKKGNKKNPVNQQEDKKEQVEAQKEKVDDVQDGKSKRQKKGNKKNAEKQEDDDKEQVEAAEPEEKKEIEVEKENGELTHFKKSIKKRKIEMNEQLPVVQSAKKKKNKKMTKQEQLLVDEGSLKLREMELDEGNKVQNGGNKIELESKHLNICGENLENSIQTRSKKNKKKNKNVIVVEEAQEEGVVKSQENGVKRKALEITNIVKSKKQKKKV